MKLSESSVQKVTCKCNILRQTVLTTQNAGLIPLHFTDVSSSLSVTTHSTYNIMKILEKQHGQKLKK